MCTHSAFHYKVTTNQNAKAILIQDTYTAAQFHSQNTIWEWDWQTLFPIFVSIASCTQNWVRSHTHSNTGSGGELTTTRIIVGISPAVVLLGRKYKADYPEIVCSNSLPAI